MKGETAEQAAARAAQQVISRIIATDEDGDPRLDPGCSLSPAHDLLPNSCVKLAGEWVVFRRLDAAGHLVVSKPGSSCFWTYEPTDGERFLSALPF